MTRVLATKKSEAQQVKLYLTEHDMLSHEHHIDKDEEYIYFPITNTYSGKWPVQERNMKARSYQPRAIPFKEALTSILSAEELQLAKTAYEVVGETAIIEVPDSLRNKEKDIAQALLDSNDALKTILRKAGGHQGTFRTQDMIVLAGTKTTVATYRENNCWITYDLSDMYFSARLATERKRIYSQVQEGENVLVMFSGAAPYPCVIAKNTDAKKVVGVEINPSGHEFGLQNVKKNKLDTVELYCGDVREIVPTLKGKFDRIAMPLPKTAEEFLDVALQVAKKNCIIHLYGFYHEDEFEKAYAEIAKYCKAANRDYTIISTTKVGQQSPRTYRICVDFEVLN